MKDACDRDKWREVVKSMTIRNPSYSVDEEETESKLNRWWVMIITTSTLLKYFLNIIQRPLKLELN